MTNIDPTGSNADTAVKGVGDQAANAPENNEQVNVDKAKAPASQTPNTPAANEIDYKAENEKLMKRLSGQDRLINQLRSRRSKASDEMSDTGDDEETELNKLRASNAEFTLKEKVKDILESYPSVPKNVADAIKKNPRGWLRSSTATVDDALLDLEEVIADISDQNSQGDNPGQTVSGNPQQTAVAPVNATVSSNGKKMDVESMTPDQINAALDAGKLTMQDLEEIATQKAKERTKAN